MCSEKGFTALSFLCAYLTTNMEEMCPPSSLLVISLSSPRPPPLLPAGILCTEAVSGVIYQFDKLPESSAWSEMLGGDKLSWLCALVTSNIIVRGTSYSKCLRQSKLQALIDLKSLHILHKQRAMRAQVAQRLTHGSKLPINRPDFRHTRKPTIHNARVTKQLERK